MDKIFMSAAETLPNISTANALVFLLDVWLFVGLRNQKEKFLKTVLFARSVSHIADIYEFTKTELGRDAYASHECDVSNQLLSQFQLGRVWMKWFYQTLQVNNLFNVY